MLQFHHSVKHSIHPLHVNLLIMDAASSYLDYYWINVGFFSSFAAKFFLITWSFVFIYSVHDISWSKTISKCAILFSIMALGYGVGSTYFSRYVGKLSGLVVYRWTFLSVSLLVLSIVTKFALIAIICGIIGLLVGSTVASISRHLRNRHMKSTLMYNPGVVDDVSLTNMKYQTMSLCFCPLFIIVLYDPAYDAKFPALLPSLAYAWTCMLVIFFHLKLHEWFRSSASNGGGGGASSVGDGGDSSSALAKPRAVKLDPYTGTIPKAFVNFNGTEAKARVAVDAMLQWRADNNIDEVLTTYQPFFSDILKNYPHYMHGHAKDGSLIVYELVGRANLEGLKGVGMNIDQMAHHFTLRNEMLAKQFLGLDYSSVGVSSPELAQKQPKQLVAILDCDGISMDKISFVDIMSFIAKTSFVLDNYFPTMVQRVFIVNSSYAFQYAWGFASAVLPAELKNKLSFPPLSGLDEFIDPSERPQKYGGTSDLNLGDDPVHKAFVELPSTWIKPEEPVGGLGAGVGVGASEAGADMEEGGKKGEGLLGKLYGAFSGRRREEPTEAHLGGNLRLVFDKSVNRWVTAGDDEVNEKTPMLSKRGSDEGDSDASDEFFDTQDTAEGVEGEANVIQAIEAAHVARAMMSSEGRDRKASRRRPDTTGNHHYSSEVSAAIRQSGSRGQLDGAVSSDVTDPGVSRPDKDGGRRAPPSVQMLVIIFVFQLLTSIMFHGLLFILPAFCLTPSHRGGLNYTLTDLGLIMSTTGLLLYVLFLSVLQPKCAALVKLSPVRALRVAMGTMILALFLLPILCSSKDVISTGDAALMMEVDDWKAMHPDYLKSSVLPSGTEGAAAKEGGSWSLLAVLTLPWTILMLLLNHTPCESVFGLCLPSLLLSATIASSYLSRRAATLISYATLLNSSFAVDADNIKSLFSFIDNFAAVVVRHCGARQILLMSFLLPLICLYYCVLFLL